MSVLGVGCVRKRDGGGGSWAGGVLSEHYDIFGVSSAGT